MRLTATILIASLISATGAASAQPISGELRQQLDELQTTESMMAAAFALVDRQEMRRQGERARKLFFWYETFPQRKSFVECGKAVLMLDMFATAALAENAAQSYIVANRYLDQFRRTIPICERKAGINPTPKPNLRTFP